MKQQYTMELVHTKCKPKFTHEFALSSLKSQGYNLAVFSNSVRNTLEVMMQKSNLIKHLGYMVSNEDVLNGKPDPEMYLKAMTHFNLRPDECLIVEDNENGIRAARASGAHLLIVKDPSELTLENLLRSINNAELSQEERALS